GLTVFDAPSADETTVRRIRSNTPMQALTTLNDEVFVEAAQAFALRLLQEVPGDDSARLRYGFRLCVAREPDSFETNTLVAVLHNGINQFKPKPKAARSLLPEHAPAEIDPAR